LSFLARVYVSPTDTLFYIDFEIDQYDGVNVDIQLLYQKTDNITFAAGLAQIQIDGLGGGGFLEVDAIATYCSAPLTPSSASIGSNYPYKFLIATVSNFSYGMYGRDVGNAKLILAKPAEIVNHEVEIMDWEFIIKGSTTLDELQDSLSASVEIIIAESTVQDFIVHVNTSFSNVVFVSIDVDLKDPLHCKKGDLWSGDGIVTVKAIPSLGDLTVECDWDMACDGSGKFDIDLKIELGSSTSFNCLGMDFGVAEIDILVSRATKSAPIHTVITGALSGVDNLRASLSFDMPYTDMNISVTYIAGDYAVVQNSRSASGLTVSNPGSMVAVLGQPSSNIKSSTDMNGAKVVPPVSIHLLYFFFF
jgi:hypothetical protein